MRDFIQCCYTRVGGQGAGSGWQIVASSDNIPYNVRNNYEKLQNAYILTGGAPVDKDGKPLNLFNISVKDDEIFISKIMYGLKDRLGRENNMFAHSFGFSLKNTNVIKYPNEFLTISDENFKTCEADAMPVPEQLKKLPCFTLKEALKICDLGDEQYKTLIYCIYAQIYIVKGKKPLYIHGVNDEMKLKALLYCIYSGIPYSMRRVLSCVTANLNDNIKENLIFSEQHTSFDYYLDPITGNNNILTSRTISKFTKQDYINHIFSIKEEEKLNIFFEELENIAIKLGDCQAFHMDVLKIAYQIMTGADITQYTEDELMGSMYDVLNSSGDESLFLDQYIAKLLEQINKKSYELTDEVEQLLHQKLENTKSMELKQVGENYDIQCLSRIEIEKAAKKLRQMKATMFKTYSKKLVTLSTGNEILDFYYSTYCLNENSTWKQLKELLGEIDYLKVKNKTIDKIQAIAWECYERELKGDRDPQIAYDDYIDVMQKTGIEGNNILNVATAAKVAYWDIFSLSSFKKDKKNEYEFFFCEKNEKCQLAMELLELLPKISSKFSNNVLAQVFYYVIRNKEQFARETEKETLLQIILEASNQKHKVEYKLAIYFMDERLFEQFMKFKEIYIPKKPECFLEEYESLREALYLRDEEAKLVNKQFIRYALLWEAKNEERMIPIDVWLKLGENEFENPFEIFDQENNEIHAMQEDAEFVYMNSKLLQDKRYQEYAEEYIDNNGEYAKEVKIWLNMAKQEEKKNKKKRKNKKYTEELFNKSYLEDSQDTKDLEEEYFSKFTEKNNSLYRTEEYSSRKIQKERENNSNKDIEEISFSEPKKYFNNDDRELKEKQNEQIVTILEEERDKESFIIKIIKKIFGNKRRL